MSKIKSIISKILIAIISFIILIVIVNCLNGNIQFTLGDNTYFAGLGFINYNIRYDYIGLDCENKEFPLEVTFENHTFREINKISWSIIAKLPGRSTDLADLLSRYRTSDRIIGKSERSGVCSRIPEISSSEDPSKLIWSMKINNVEFN